MLLAKVHSLIDKSLHKANKGTVDETLSMPTYIHFNFLVRDCYIVHNGLGPSSMSFSIQ